MITPKMIADKTMTPAKRKIAYNDFFAFYIGRPLSYIVSIPFIYLRLKPKTISLLSMLPPILGFLVFYKVHTLFGLILGWLCFFLWNILDGVDGNVARYTGQTSKMGSVYDAMSGYIAMTLTFFAAGVGAVHQGGVLSSYIPSETLIILGALAGIFMLFPRLVMHKAISTFMSTDSVASVKDKSGFNLVKVLALNLESVSGGAQVLFLVAIVLHILDLYVIAYFAFNGLVMLVSLRDILKD